MKFIIAERIGRTLQELDESMSYEEFQEWYVLLTKIEPWEREEANKGK